MTEAWFWGLVWLNGTIAEIVTWLGLVVCRELRHQGKRGGSRFTYIQLSMLKLMTLPVISYSAYRFAKACVE